MKKIASLLAAGLIALPGLAMADNDVSLSYSNLDLDAGAVSATLEGYVLGSRGNYDNGVAYNLEYTNADGGGLDYEGARADVRVLLGGSNFGVAADYRWDELNGATDVYRGIGGAFGWSDSIYSVDAKVTSDVNNFFDDHAVTLEGAYALNSHVDLTAGYDYINKSNADKKHEYSVGARYTLTSGATLNGDYTRIEFGQADVDRFQVGVGFAF